MAASESRVAEADRSFERLYRTHRRDVYNFVLHDVRNPEEAEDVTQLAFLNAYRALRRGRPPEKPRAWLLTIAQNVSRRRFRRRSAQIQEVPLDAELAVAADPYEGPTAEEIHAAFRVLPDKQRSALAMRELQGRSYAEIADELGVSIPAVETLIFRARRALRTQLEPEESKLRGFLLAPLALPGLIVKAIGSVSASAGRFGIGARTAGAVGALMLGAGAVEFVPPILADEEPPAVVEIARAKTIAPSLAAEPRPAVAENAKALNEKSNTLSPNGGLAAGNGAGVVPGLPIEMPPLPVETPQLPTLPVEVSELPTVEVPSVEVPTLPPPPELPPPPLPDLG
jgi:RNA polymerase sigma-70 factor, ECF subfamily